MDNISPEIKRIIARYRAELERRGIKVTSVHLYGSQRKGTATEYSDIDLIVVSPDFTRMNLLERLETLGAAAGRIFEPVQAYGVTPDEVKEGKLTHFWRTMLEEESVRVSRGRGHGA